jgi:hypothetical protein
VIRISSADILTSPLSPSHAYWAYNAMDCAVTAKVWSELDPLLASSPHASAAYSHHRAVQAVALSMMQEGTLVNPIERSLLITHYEKEKEDAQVLLDRLADAVWGPEVYEERTKTEVWETPVGKHGQLLKPRRKVEYVVETRTRPRGLNASSSKQVIAFFTIALGLPEQYALRKVGGGHDRTPTADDKAMEKWKGMKARGRGAARSEVAVHIGAPFASLILTVRRATKMLSFLRSSTDPDGHMRCSFNVGGTTSGRWSSSTNVYGRGTNLQALDREARRMFVADEGYVFIAPDLERAESYATGALAWAVTGQDGYLRACQGADLHVGVARMTWPELPWTGEDKPDRAIADQRPAKYGGQKSYRDLSKNIGHGSNYMGSPYGIAIEYPGISIETVEEFQSRYFPAFPELRLYQENVIEKIKSTSTLYSALGWRHTFFGRPDDKSTHREAVAHASQHLIGVLLNKILLAVWRLSTDPTSPLSSLRFHLQVHDSFVVSCPLPRLSEVIPLIDQEFKRAVVEIHSELDGSILPLTIPSEFKIGWNWADRDPDHLTFADGNPDGLDKWRGGLGDRRRQRPARPKPSDWLNLTLP